MTLMMIANCNSAARPWVGARPPAATGVGCSGHHHPQSGCGGSGQGPGSGGGGGGGGGRGGVVSDRCLDTAPSRGSYGCVGHHMIRTSTGVGGGGCLSDVDTPKFCAAMEQQQQQREFMNHCSTPDPVTTGPNNSIGGNGGVNVGGNSGKVLSRNANGTIAMTSQPTNESELQLYRVLQRANLLSYYDTFIGQGGDDVQQLCEAGEEEFLEIMALVGMASKPLHVRRLQKALQEWVNNPAMFQTPLVPSLPGHALPPMASVAASRPMNLSQHNHLPPTRPSPPMPMIPNNHPPSPSPLTTKETAPSPTPLQMQQQQPTPIMAQANGGTPEKEKPDSCPPFYLFFKGSDHSSNEYGQPGSPLQLTPVLVESQIQRLSEAAELLIKSLPPFEPKPQNSKKKICKELEYVISMADDDPRRMDEIRKYAAIYGRFDCKRKPEKPLTLHEVSVNEAAAQICRHIPALLTRRDELFPLARQVVRDSGYQYSKGHSRSHPYNPRNYSNCDDPSSKRARLEQGSPDSNSNKHGGGDMGRLKRQERLESLGEELKQLTMQQEELRARLTQARDAQDYPIAQQMQQQLEQLNAQQVQMMSEQNELIKRIRQSRFYGSKGNGRMSSCSDPERPDTDDTDSQYSFSNTSSPSQDVHDSSSQDYPTASSGGGGELKMPVQMQDMFPLKGSNGGNGSGGKKSSAGHITKQMMQETLMDEGLRVVKELSNQIKEDPDSLVGVAGMSLSMAMAMAAAAANEGLPGLPSVAPSPHHSHHHHHHHSHPHHHHHQSSSPVLPTHPAMHPSYRYACATGSMGMMGSGSGGGGGCPVGNTTNGNVVRDRDSRANGQGSSNGGQDADGVAPSSDVEKAAASTINALLSLSQNAGRGLKQELPSPPCTKSD